MATQITYVKEVADTFSTIAAQLSSEDILEFALGDHDKWSIKFADVSAWGWTVGQNYNIIGRRAAVVSAGTGSPSTEEEDTLSVSVSQPAITVIEGTGVSLALDAQTVLVSEQVPQVVIPKTVVVGTQDVPVVQPVAIVQIPVGDIVLWYFDGVEWVSFQTQQLVTSFSDTSPYTGDEFAIIGGVTSDASNIGMRMRRSTRWVTMSIRSDEGIGTPPTSSCSVHIFVDGASVASMSFDGSTYGASGVIDVDASAGALVTFKYVDDAGGQSAGKVVVMAEYRWRRA